MVPSYLVEKYISLCSLPGLVKLENKWNFRCIVCGDSKTNKNKKRGYILYDQSRYKVPVYSCRNCGVTLSFNSFLYKHRQHLYKDYKRECLESGLFGPVIKPEPSKEEIEIPVNENSNVHDIIVNLERAKNNAKALEYCMKRKLPESFISELLYTGNFIKHVTENKIMEFANIPDSDERIIIPVYDKDKNLTHIQGRALYPTELKYITITIKDQFKIWGMDRIKYSEKVFCFEGVFDACFIPNSVATLGAQFNAKNLRQYANVYCPDFDIYTNKHVRKKCLDWVQVGGDLFIPPEGINGKDVNELIQNGVEINKVVELIQNNVYNSISAIVRLKAMGN